jgi:hypothetical protein
MAVHFGIAEGCELRPLLDDAVLAAVVGIEWDEGSGIAMEEFVAESLRRQIVDFFIGRFGVFV